MCSATYWSPFFYIPHPMNERFEKSDLRNIQSFPAFTDINVVWNIYKQKTYIPIHERCVEMDQNIRAAIKQRSLDKRSTVQLSDVLCDIKIFDIFDHWSKRWTYWNIRYSKLSCCVERKTVWSIGGVKNKSINHCQHSLASTGFSVEFNRRRDESYGGEGGWGYSCKHRLSRANTVAHDPELRSSAVMKSLEQSQQTNKKKSILGFYFSDHLLFQTHTDRQRANEQKRKRTTVHRWTKE